MKTINELNKQHEQQHRPVRVRNGKHIGYGFIDHLAAINRKDEQE